MNKNNFSNVGIAIITYNRAEYLAKCLNSIYRSNIGDAHIVVFDDCSSDNTIEIANKYGKVIQTPVNGGVIRNKNRALKYFTDKNNIEYIILLEDDVLIEKPENWLQQWVDATEKFGHMNYSAPWFMHETLRHNFISGNGTSNDPHIFKIVTGQCSSVKSDLVKNKVGFLNPRFIGFGHGHVEWTNRLISQNTGGYFKDGVRYYMAIDGGISAPPSPSFKCVKQLNRNAEVHKELLNNDFDEIVKVPWLNNEEKELHFKEVL